jgi:hypothetical protein
LWRLHKEAHMRRWLHRSLLVVAAVMVLGTVPALAVGPFGPAVPVVDPGCRVEEDYADATRGPDGVVRGFYGYWVNPGPACYDPSLPLWYFEGSGDNWTRVMSPYRGRVLAVTQDTTAVYLLYEATDGIRITKRTAAGFTPGRIISPVGFGARTVPQGDVIASGGTWWAVWTEPTNPAVVSSAELYQAKTFGADQPRRRLTTNSVDDVEPTLVFRPGGGAAMFWTRWNSFQNPTASDIRKATSDDGAWSSAPFATLGTVNTAPDAAVAGRTTYVAWGRDGTVKVADYVGGWRSVTLDDPAALEGSPKLAVSGGQVFAGWNKVNPATFARRVRVAERAGGTWTTATLGAAGDQLVHRVVSANGRATVLLSDWTRLLARTETS